MTSTVLVHKDRTLFWGVLVSVLLHAFLLMPFVQDFVSSFVPEDFLEREPVVVIVPPIEFVLVSPPERPTPSTNLSKYLSVVSSKASDLVDTGEKTALPHSEGVIPIPDTPSRTEGAEGGGESELPPLPEEETNLGEAFQRSRFLDQSSPRREPSFPTENPAYDNPGSVRASVGGISINTTAWDFAPYLLDLKRRIKQHWIPPFAFTALGAIHGYTKISFRIYPDGSMQAMTVIESRGHNSLHRTSENAIKGGAPFRRLPERFPEEYLDVIFGFYYLLPGDEKEFFKKE